MGLLAQQETKCHGFPCATDKRFRGQRSRFKGDEIEVEVGGTRGNTVGIPLGRARGNHTRLTLGNSSVYLPAWVRV